MKAYVVADPKIAKTIYSIFDKKELSKYIEYFIKKYTQANSVIIDPCYEGTLHLEPKVKIFSVGTKINIPLDSLKIEYIYDEESWNPYPELKPMAKGWSEWLVQCKDNELRVGWFFAEGAKEQGLWFSDKEKDSGYQLTQVIAFRKLPGRYSNEI